MLSCSSLRWTISLLVILVLIGQLTEGKRGGGGGGRSSGGRGSSAARSSSKSGGFFGKSSGSRSSGKSWWSSSKSSSRSRSGGGFKSSRGGGGWGWGSANARPSVTHDSVSRGLFGYSRPSGYYGPAFGTNCAFGGCGNTYTVYHYYPRSHYYSSRRTTTSTPAPIGPKADQVANALDDYDTITYNGLNGTDSDNTTEVMEIADPARPLLIQDLAFFWDTKYLPSKDATGCPSYLPVNSNETISYCGVQEYSRCQRNLTELPVYKPEIIFFPDGTTPSHLAWLCPADTTCCDWECCHDDEGWGFIEYILLVIFICLGLYYSYKCFRFCCQGWVQDCADRKYERERERLNRGSA